MVLQTEAVFENGVFRPLNPLSLPDRQRVLLTVAEVPSEPAERHRYEEQAWLRLHEREFASQWVALHGSELISHGSNARAVLDSARARGVQRPLLVHIDDDPGAPAAGLLLL
jgi:predicted DNA-binding antitoxin AbrB/MazE fold protein